MAYYQYSQPLNEHFPKVAASDYDPFLQRPLSNPSPIAPKAHHPTHLVRRKGFKPVAHRTVSIAFLAFLILGLIGLLEYTTHKLPQVTFNLASQARDSTLQRRQDYGSSDPSSDPSVDPSLDPSSDLPDSQVGTNPDDTVPDDGSANDGPPAWATASTIKDTGYAGDAATTVVQTFTPISASTAYAKDTAVTSIIANVGVNTQIGAPDVPTTANTAYAPDGATSVWNAPPLATITSMSILTGAGGVVTGTLAVTAVVTEPPDGSPASSAYLVASGGTMTGSGYASATSAVGLGSGNHDEVTLESGMPLTLITHHENYFIGIYLPILIAVILRLFVGYFYRCTHLLDPFFALMEEGGAAFKDFFWAEHLAAQPFWSPIHAFASQRWTLFGSAMLYAMSQLITPFASELISVHPSNYNFVNEFERGYVRGNAIWVNITIVRIIQSILGLMFVVLVVLWIALRRKDCGVSTSPASIATIASIVSHPNVAEDFSSIDQQAPKDVSTKRMGMQHYQLDFFDAPDGSHLYGIQPVSGSYISMPAARPHGHAEYHNVPTSMHHPRPDYYADTPVKRSLFKGGLGSLLFMTAACGTLLGMIIAYYLNHEPTNFEHFMDSQSFGPRFVLSALGLSLKSPLIILCARTAATVPFSRLASKPRDAYPDLLDPVPVTPIGVIGWALRRGEFFCASLGVAAGLVVEALLIFLTGVPYEASQLWIAALVSWYGCMGCLGFIMLIAIVGWCKAVFTREGWPRSPTTVGAVAMYTAGTELAAECGADRVGLDDARQYEFGLRHGRWVVEFAGYGGAEVVENTAYNRESMVSRFN